MAAQEPSATSGQDPRYDVSIFETPFKQLPDPKRVWLGEPSSALEGLGQYS